MKRFIFSLQALQTLRQRQEQVALEQYAQALTSRQQAADNLASVRAHCEESWMLRRQQMAGGAHAALVTQTESYCFSVEQQMKKCEAAIRQAQSVVDQGWKKLVAARQAREAVDKYREQQVNRYERELLREEQKALDELVRRAPIGASVRLNSEEAWN